MCEYLTRRTAMALSTTALAYLCLMPTAEAQTYMAMQYNEFVRIVLSNVPCSDGQGWRAAAQRIDKQYMHACWTREPVNKLIRIQWEGGDFSVFDADRFKQVEVND